MNLLEESTQLNSYNLLSKHAVKILLKANLSLLLRTGYVQNLQLIFKLWEQDVVQIANQSRYFASWRSQKLSGHLFLITSTARIHDLADRNSKKAKIWENKADALVKEIRTLTKNQLTFRECLNELL